MPQGGKGSCVSIILHNAASQFSGTLILLLRDVPRIFNYGFG
jgi:hypothetical protein